MSWWTTRCVARTGVAVSTNGNDQQSSAQIDVAAILAGGTATGHWVIDPAQSRVQFHVKHFWGAITVHGSFAQITGEATFGADGTVTGRVSMDAASLDTKNSKRDRHLRSGDFFDVERHPHAVVTVTSAKPAGRTMLACEGTLDAAGHVAPIQFNAELHDVSDPGVTLVAEIVVDRTLFDMTWSPLGMASKMARATVEAHFVRA
jgi:polyisoprenoid-binding protein YceI